jgi:penicillin-binding protein activator
MPSTPYTFQEHEMLEAIAGRIARAGLIACVVVLAGSSLGCASKRVSRIDPGTVTDLSGRWNDTDSRLVANALIEKSLTNSWARRYAELHGGEAPTIIIGDFTNKTMEHVPVGTFVRDLERAYVGSGAVRVVASAAERQDVRAERQDQQQNARSDTRARMGQELGAKFMLQGELQAIEDGAGKEKVVFYQVDATLIDLESNTKVWVGDHKIKKYIERRPFGW